MRLTSSLKYLTIAHGINGMITELHANSSQTHVRNIVLMVIREPMPVVLGVHILHF